MNVDRLCRRVFAGARDEAVDRTDAFDLAVLVLASRPADARATELASLSIDGMASWSRMAELALMLLAEVRSDPGFPREPGWSMCLDDAMRLVNRDVAATGLGSRCRLRLRDDDVGHLYVESWTGEPGTGSGIGSSVGADPVSALVAVAEDTQDAVVHTLWSAWPVCPGHRLGVRAREHDGAGVWWCPGESGHVAAAIGGWQRR